MNVEDIDRRTVRKVNDIDIARDDVPHACGPALSPDAEDVGKVDPKCAVFHNNVLGRFGILSGNGGAFYRDTIVVSVNEAVANSDVAGIARVDTVVVPAAGAADAKVANEDLVAA
jgi:hypothetical protein